MDGMMKEHKSLRLLARDSDGLQILSALLQDAICKFDNIIYDNQARRLHIAFNRYTWENAQKITHDSGNDSAQHGWRVRSILSIESVLSVQMRGIDVQKDDTPRTKDSSDNGPILSMMALRFEPEIDPPSGIVRVIFSGAADIQLSVECLDVILMDTEHIWLAKMRPEHGENISSNEVG